MCKMRMKRKRLIMIQQHQGNGAVSAVATVTPNAENAKQERRSSAKTVPVMHFLDFDFVLNFSFYNEEIIFNGRH